MNKRSIFTYLCYLFHIDFTSYNLNNNFFNQVLMKCGSAVRNRVVDIELTWLHAPLEDQSVGLLNLVADGLVSPLLCHLIGLPLVQVTLDRAYSVSDLRNTFNLENPEAYKNFINGPLLDPIEFPSLTVNADGSGTLEDHGVFGAYDNCLPTAFSLPADNTKVMIFVSTSLLVVSLFYSSDA